VNQPFRGSSKRLVVFLAALVRDDGIYGVIDFEAGAAA